MHKIHLCMQVYLYILTNLYVDDTSLTDATTPVSEVRITFMFISIYAWYLPTVQIQI